MAVPQVVVIGLLLAWERHGHAALVAALLAGQLALMVRFLKSPRERAAWYNGTGTTLYVLGMLVAAFALRPLVGGA
jgi:chlorophyll synthase